MLTETALTSGDGVLQLWDPRTGTILATYKVTRGGCHPRCLAVGNASFRGGSTRPGVMYAAQADKAMMNAYQFERVSRIDFVNVCASKLMNAAQDQPFLKFTLPEAGTAVAVSHSGIYCAMGTASGRIYVWEASNLLLTS
jgi:pre-rRNA-processing protein IPI3